MSDIIGYFKDDLKVYLKENLNSEEEIKESIMHPISLKHYTFLIMFKGSVEISLNHKKSKISGGQMVFADVNTQFAFNYIKPEQIYYLHMIIFPSVLNEKSDDKFFLRALQDMPDDKRIINIDATKFSEIKSSTNAIVKCIRKGFGRAHILPRIRSIISELDMYYDEKFVTDKRTSDSVFVNIAKYIEHHYMENITYELICNNFFVSKPTVIKLLKLNTGMTMHQYIESLRMEAAQKMISEGLEIVRVATMCGYNSYSSFFRAYKKFYGTLPSESRKTKQKKHPLS